MSPPLSQGGGGERSRASPEGGVWGFSLHDGQQPGEQALLAVTHQAAVRVDQGLHLGDVGFHGDGAELVQLLAVQQQVLVPGRARGADRKRDRARGRGLGLIHGSPPMRLRSVRYRWDIVRGVVVTYSW